MKRSFLLLEVIMAFALLVSCLFPLLKTNSTLSQHAFKRIEKMHLQRLSQVSFAELRCMLYENRSHNFEDLSNGAEGTLPTKQTVPFGKDKQKTYLCKYKITPLEQCLKKSTMENYLLIEIELTFVAQNKERGSFKTTMLVQEHAET